MKDRKITFRVTQEEYTLIDKMKKTELDSKVCSEYHEQFQMVAWIALLLLIVELLIFDRKNRIFKKVKIFS